MGVLDVYRNSCTSLFLCFFHHANIFFSACISGGGGGGGGGANFGNAASEYAAQSGLGYVARIYADCCGNAAIIGDCFRY